MYSRKQFMRSVVTLSSILILGASLLCPSSASAVDISGCVNKRTGILRVSKVCKKTEYSIVWSQDGAAPRALLDLPALRVQQVLLD